MRTTSLPLLDILATTMLSAQTPRGEEYLQLTNDGAWCWFSDPRAVYHQGTTQRLYAGWASKGGLVRGNGWVMAGLVSILRELPAHSKYRPSYVSLCRVMAPKVAALQDSSGFWHASLLDPASHPNPETSCTGFFCYALAHGINAGILERESYSSRVRKAWDALVESVSSDGKLGWVQPAGEDPKRVQASMSDVYGAGAFPLAGTEIWALAD